MLPSSQDLPKSVTPAHFGAAMELPASCARAMPWTCRCSNFVSNGLKRLSRDATELIYLNVCQGRYLFRKKVGMLKVLKMSLPILENLGGLCGNIFSLFRSTQFHLGKKSATMIESC